MSRRNIPESEWVRFFYEFNKQHRNLIVSVNVKDKKNDVELIRELPLKELDINPRADNNTIVQVIGGDSSNVTHFIDKTTKIEFEESENNLPRQISIYSDTGSITNINFLSMESKQQV